MRGSPSLLRCSDLQRQPSPRLRAQLKDRVGTEAIHTTTGLSGITAMVQLIDQLIDVPRQRANPTAASLMRAKDATHLPLSGWGPAHPSSELL